MISTPHRVFVTGATGFVGLSVIHALRAHGAVVRCLVRHGSEQDLRGLEAIERVEGDVLNARGLADAVAGCDVVIHLVGIIREHRARSVTFEAVHHHATLNVLNAAATVGVRRFLHMSALGTRPGARSRYHQTKWAAEEKVRESPLAWTIFRPSIIYGRGDGFVTMLAGMVHRGVVPLIGDGHQRVQPIPVEQVAEALASAIDLPATVKHTFDVGGPDTITMTALVDLIRAVTGKRRVLKIHVPVRFLRMVAQLFQPFPSFPITPDQLLMLEANNTCDPAAFFTTFGLTPVALRAGLARMLD